MHATTTAEGMRLPSRLVVPRIAVDGARLAELSLLIVSGVLLLVSLLLPYWQITLHAPQYPKGLYVQAYANKLTGDIFEVDGLNHYIGMMKLNDAAVIERAIAQGAIIAIAILAVVSFWLPGIWRTLARVPIIIFPAVFAADLFAWLYYAGHSLDPYAPLSSSIKPFTPHILGVGTIGQFSTEAVFLPGFILTVMAALLALAVTIATRSRRDVAR
jgi:hypothetical protein